MARRYHRPHVFSSPTFNQGETKPLKVTWSSCGVPAHCRGVELDGPHRSLPTLRVLWFYEGVFRGWCVCLWDARWPCVVAAVWGRVTADPTHHLVCDFTLQGQEQPLTGISPHVLLCELGPAALQWKPAVLMVGLLLLFPHSYLLRQRLLARPLNQALHIKDNTEIIIQNFQSLCLNGWNVPGGV